MRSETYIEDRLEWLKEVAESLFPPGSSGLEEETEEGGSAEDKDFPADNDSRDGDYKYERLSEFSSEYDEWESEQEWERVNRRYEEVEELVRRYIGREDRQQKNVGSARRKTEYLLKFREILDTRKKAFVSAVEVYEGVGRDLEGLGRDFMDIKESVMGWHREGWPAYLEMEKVREGDARKEMKEFYALSMGRILPLGSQFAWLD
jgi:hypothetical protein